MPLPQDDLRRQLAQSLLDKSTAGGLTHQRMDRIRQIADMGVDQIYADPQSAVHTFQQAWDEASFEERMAMRPVRHHFFDRVRAIQGLEYDPTELSAMMEAQTELRPGRIGGEGGRTALSRFLGEAGGTFLNLGAGIGETLGAEMPSKEDVPEEFTRMLRGRDGSPWRTGAHRDVMQQMLHKAAAREEMGLPSGVDPELLERFKEDVAPEGIFNPKVLGRVAGFLLPATGMAKGAGVALQGMRGGGLLAEALGFGAASAMTERDVGEFFPGAAFGVAAGGTHRALARGALGVEAARGGTTALTRGLRGGAGLREYPGRALASALSLGTGQAASNVVRGDAPMEGTHPLATALFGAAFGIPGRRLPVHHRTGEPWRGFQPQRLRGSAAIEEAMFGRRALPQGRRQIPSPEGGPGLPVPRVREGAIRGGPEMPARGEGVLALGEALIPPERRLPAGRAAPEPEVRVEPRPGPARAEAPPTALQKAIESAPVVFPRGRQQKRYISDVWRAYQRETGDYVDLPRFQRMLWEEHAKGAEGAVRLSRADLVEALDPQRVRESEFRPIEGGPSAFNLVELRAPREGLRRLHGPARYHGTYRPITELRGKEAYRESLQNPVNIYGQGLYTTDSLDVAEGYSRAGGIFRKGRRIYRVEEKPGTKLFDMEEQLTGDLRETLGRIQENLRSRLGVRDEVGDFMGLRRSMEYGTAGAKNLREVYDNIERGMTPGNAQQVFSEIQGHLEQEGYHGLRHIGGARTGYPPHEVKIYWDPSSSISAHETATRSLSPEERRLQKQIKAKRRMGPQLSGIKPIELPEAKMEMLQERKPPPRPEGGFLDLGVVAKMIQRGAELPGKILSGLADWVWHKLGQGAQKFASVLRLLRKRFGSGADRYARDVHDVVTNRYMTSPRPRPEQVRAARGKFSREVKPYGVERLQGELDPIDAAVLGARIARPQARRGLLGMGKKFLAMQHEPMTHLTAKVAAEKGNMELSRAIEHHGLQVQHQTRRIFGDLMEVAGGAKALQRLGAAPPRGGALRPGSISQQARDFKAARSLSILERDEDFPSLFWGRWMEAIEDSIPHVSRKRWILDEPPPPLLTKDEQALVDLARPVIDRVGQIAEQMGLMQRKADGSFEPFKRVPGGKVAARIMTAEAWGIFAAGPGNEAWQLIERDVLIGKNRRTPEDAQRIMEGWRKKMLMTSTEGGEIGTRHAWVEVGREVEFWPTAIEVKGQRILLQEPVPAAWMQRYIDRNPQRLAFVRIFGQDLPKSPSAWRQMEKDWPGRPEAFHRWLRVLQGLPMVDPKIPPGEYGYEALQDLRSVMSLANAAFLSRSALVNVPEVFFSKAAVQYRWENVVKAMREGDRDPWLRSIGAIGEDWINLVSLRDVNARRWMRDKVRLLREGSSRAFLYQFLNEWQERIAARSADFLVDDWRAGTFSPQRLSADRVMLQNQYKFSRATAERMVRGEGTQVEYESFIQRAGSITVAAQRFPVESSILANHPWYRILLPFQRYNQTVANTIANDVGGILDGLKLGDGEAAVQSARQMFRNIGYGSAQYMLGRALVALTSTLSLAGLHMWWTEEQQKWEENFVREGGSMLLNQYMFGPIGGLVASSEYAGSWYEAAGTVSIPGRMGFELLQVVGQIVDPGNEKSGRYRDYAPLEAAYVWLTRPFSAKPQLKALVASMGLSGDDPELDRAIRWYWGWVDRNMPQEFGRSQNVDYRIAMRRAKEEFRKKDGDPIPALLDAFGAKIDEGMSAAEARRAIVRAVKDRRLIASLPSIRQREFLVDAPSTVVEKLMLHDSVLEEYAKAISRAWR